MTTEYLRHAEIAFSRNYFRVTTEYLRHAEVGLSVGVGVVSQSTAAWGSQMLPSSPSSGLSRQVVVGRIDAEFVGAIAGPGAPAGSDVGTPTKRPMGCSRTVTRTPGSSTGPTGLDARVQVGRVARTRTQHDQIAVHAAGDGARVVPIGRPGEVQSWAVGPPVVPPVPTSLAHSESLG